MHERKQYSKKQLIEETISGKRKPIGRVITRKEALEICNQNLIDAEQRRLEFREEEAKRDSLPEDLE